MKYQLGDKVLLLHSNEEGEIVDIINDKMVLIDVEGVRFPVYMDQIDFPYFKRFSEKKFARQKKEKIYIDSIKKEKAIEKSKVSTGVWLSFLPVFDKDVFDDDVVEKFKIYLNNQTDESYDFIYQIKFKGSPEFHLKNSVAPFADFYLHDIPFEEMRLKNQPTFSFILFENYPDKMEEVIPDYHNSYGQLYNVSRLREKLEPARSVVDLHIEKLTDNWQGLSNFEILSIQLQNFEKFYNLAIAHRQPNLIVIHGVGTGKLRNEIHEILKLKREVKSFANQYHENFGFGATEIFFQY